MTRRGCGGEEVEERRLEAPRERRNAAVASAVKTITITVSAVGATRRFNREITDDDDEEEDHEEDTYFLERTSRF